MNTPSSYPQNRRVAPELRSRVLPDGGEGPPRAPRPRVSSIPPVAAPSAAPSPPTRLGKALRRAASFLRLAFGVALVAACAIALAVSGRRYVTTSARFALKDVHVTGNSFRTADAIADEGGLTPGVNVVSLDLEGARDKILHDPWIARASVTRRLPSSVRVDVTERDAVAILAIGDLYLVSHDAEVFKKLEVDDPSDLPIITGPTAELLASDRDALERQVRRALDLLADYARTPLAAKAKVGEVHLSHDGSTTLLVGKNAISLALGAPPFRRKLDEATRVLAECDKRGATPTAVMLDDEARPERVVVRMK